MLSAGQRRALDQLGAVATATPRGLEILSAQHPDQTSDWLVVEVSLDTRGIASSPEGISLRERERFQIWVPRGFPFEVPSLWVPHPRWADTPHVQWRRHLCLYQAPAVEWNPSDGMYGLLDRLLRWLEQAALDQLDPVGAPLHPPVAYTSTKREVPLVIPRADAPHVGDDPWTGMAHLATHHSRRVDIVGWSQAGIEHPDALAAAILLAHPLTFEYPRTAARLLEALHNSGVDQALVMALWQIASIQQPDGSPLITIVGAPMRGFAGGETRQHLAAWWMPPEDADSLRLTFPRPDDSQELREVRGELADAVWKVAELSDVDWCPVREDRPEVTIRRDHDTPMQNFAGKHIALWGCGALGGHVAEALVRSGVRRLTLIDSASVTPGVLVRQPYDDDDLGSSKAKRLQQRLLRIAPEADVDARQVDLVTGPLDAPDWHGGADIVIDTTASMAVRSKLELQSQAHPQPSTVTISMLIGHEASRGLVTVSPGQAVGRSAHVQRHAKLVACANPRLRSFADDLWPKQPRTDHFQPEPGCSEPTFLGSAPQVAALAAMMLNLAAERPDPPRPWWQLVALPGHDGSSSRRDRFREVADEVAVRDQLQGYEIRLSASAVSEIRAWISARRRTPGPTAETGGVLFGERDDAASIVWVTTVSGPPPDSEPSPGGFVCGTAGIDELAKHLDVRTRGASVPLGMWHSHPGGTAAPSTTDVNGMEQITEARERPQPKSLLLIVGEEEGREPQIAAYLHDRYQRRSTPTQIDVAPLARSAPPARVGLALSGGGFRAVAFHLGCLRALHDRGILEQVDVISGVSGGSLIGALWAYGERPFEDFDEAVVKLLRDGLQASITRRALASPRALQAAGTAAIAGVSGATATFSRAATRLVRAGTSPSPADRFRPRRRISRTTAFEDVLRTRLFGNATLPDVARDGLAVVLNACELRSGTAFRFGSFESGCWRFGSVAGNDVTVARAVAASAAYPMLLPAIDTDLTFLHRDSSETRERVLLTDGGVFDNTGTSCLEPERDPQYSYNVHPVDYVVACDAGHGALDVEAFPSFWPGRVKRSFESVYRKVQDASKGRLHEHADSGKLAGFALPYLGMRDEALPYRPPDLVPRDRVVGYPTNFAPMEDEDLALLTQRGEQLTRLLIEHYIPEIA